MTVELLHFLCVFPAFSGNARAVCDDPSLIRGCVAFEEVLRSFSYSLTSVSVSVWWFLLYKNEMWLRPVLVPVAGHSNTRLPKYPFMLLRQDAEETVFLSLIAFISTSTLNFPL